MFPKFTKYLRKSTMYLIWSSISKNEIYFRSNTTFFFCKYGFNSSGKGDILPLNKQTNNDENATWKMILVHCFVTLDYQGQEQMRFAAAMKIISFLSFGEEG